MDKDRKKTNFMDRHEFGSECLEGFWKTLELWGVKEDICSSREHVRATVYEFLEHMEKLYDYIDKNVKTNFKKNRS